VVVPERPDHGCFARQRDELAEKVVLRRVGGSQLGLLGPRAVGTNEDIGCPGVGADRVVAG
jgi:hypothetical protein